LNHVWDLLALAEAWWQEWLQRRASRFVAYCLAASAGWRVNLISLLESLLVEFVN